jgi:imidazolonepropionase-like amidohydrolase
MCEDNLFPEVPPVDPPAGSLVFVNVNVFDGFHDTLAEDVKVLVMDDRIQKVFTGELEGAPDHTVIDGGGRTLMPGLIDSHVHFNHTIAGGGVVALEATTWDEIGATAVAGAYEHLMNGFTTVRDAGGLGAGLKRTIDRGQLAGPRIYPSGAYISQTSGHGDLRLASQTGPELTNLERLGIISLANGRAEVLAAVRENLARGASQIKLMVGGGISSEKDPLHSMQFTDDEIRAGVEATAAWDTYVLVHVYHDAHVRRAIELGVSSIEHGHFVTAETAQLIKDRGAFHSINLAALSSDLFKHPVYGAAGSVVRLKAEAFQAQSGDLIDIVNDVGQKTVFNTDLVFATGTSFRAAIDFAKYCQADFFGNFEALKAMTSTAGELMALTGENNPYPGKLGVIEEGAHADILLVDGNPLDDIRSLGANPKWFDAEPRSDDIATIPFIMKAGAIMKNTIG